MIQEGRLRPVLSIGSLILFGVAFVGLSPSTVYGIGTARANGHLTLVFLMALVAMSLTAWSYGRMVAVYPEAGSSYTYASRALHPVVGYLAGWVMILDYVMIPAISLIIVGVNAAKVVPWVPYGVWVLGTGALITGVNLRGIKVTTRASLFLTSVLMVSIVWFLIAALAALNNGVGMGTLVSARPLYRSESFSAVGLLAAMPIAVLAFTGFDGVSTLAEDAKNARRDVGRATILVCFVAGGFFALQTYLASLVWPDHTTFSGIETAFLEVSLLVGGAGLYYLTSSLVVAQALASGVTAQAAASRLLYGMSRGGRLPRTLFGYLHPRLDTPTQSIALMGIVQVAIATLLRLDEAADLVSFGALVGFMVVNLAAARTTGLRNTTVVIPALGFATCGYIWLKLPDAAVRIGAGWTMLGVLYLAGRHYFRER